MIHAGMGHQQIESMFSTIGIPTPHHKTLKRREREIAASVHAVAKDSCTAALQEEADATRALNK